MTDGDATRLRELHVRGERSVLETVEETLRLIDSRDAELGAFTEVFASEACERARALDAARVQDEELGPLFGVPLALKSNMCVEGMETNCGSRILAGYRPPYTASFVTRALDAGCVLIGATHMDEFAMGSSGENSAYRATRNPWDTERAPGGSSSGAAAAVGAGLVPLALGSDTGGSVRQPAALCGVSGFKPTYGRISRHGLVAFGSSLDQVAPLARSVRDVVALTRVLSGPDGRDATALEDALASTGDEAVLDGLRVGVPREFFPAELDADVRVSVEAALDDLRARGATLVDVELPLVPAALSTYYVLAASEASSNLARFDGVRYGVRAAGDGSLASMMARTRTHGFGAEVKRRILLGTYALSSGYHDEWYGRAQAVRAALTADFAHLFEGAIDLLAGPTSPTPAFRIGERADPVAMYASDVLTVPASLAQLPALSVPCGFVERDARRLPVGLQLIGAHGADALVLDAGDAYQRATAHHLEAPR